MTDIQDRFEQHPVRTSLSVSAIVGAVIVALIIVGTILSLALGWFSAGVGIISPQNVKAQYQFGYEYDRSMEATARNVCIGEKRGLEPNALAAYEQTYSNIEGKYDARMANAFEAKHVKPGDLPLVAPTLSERVRQQRANGSC